MSQKGFIPVFILIIGIALVALGGGTYVAIQNVRLRADPTPILETGKEKEFEIESQEVAPEAPQKISPPTAQTKSQNLIIKEPVSPMAQGAPSLSEEFRALEKEIMEVKKSGLFFSVEHEQRVEREIASLERRRYAQSEIDRLRQMVFEISPHLQDIPKNNQPVVSNCVSNPAPVFTHHITDVEKIVYVGPPPTMGAGPNLKTHSYIGTEHARVPVYAPAAMTLESGSYYIGGPYMMEFLVSCEVKVRFGHITEPVDAIKKLLPESPQPDSRTQGLAPVSFAAGELVGYTTGTSAAGNWDFGVYNGATLNRYASDPNWNTSTVNTTAVCPFTYFRADLKSVYVSKFNPAVLGGNPPHGDSFCNP